MLQWSLILACLATLITRGSAQLAPVVRAVQDWARAHTAQVDYLVTGACGAALLFFMRDYARSLGVWLWSQIPR